MRGESFSSYVQIFPPLSSSLPPPPLYLSVTCTRGPGGSSSQPVSWSSAPEQHMIFSDYCYCLCPSSWRLQAGCAADAWLEEGRKLRKYKGWASKQFSPF